MERSLPETATKEHPMIAKDEVDHRKIHREVEADQRIETVAMENEDAITCPAREEILPTLKREV